MLTIEYINITEIKPSPKNARKHSEEQINQLIASIGEFGYTNPILIDEENNVIAGHGRLEAMKRSFKDFIACIRIVGLTENQKKAYLLADNKLALNSTWDIEALNSLIDELRDAEFELSIAGFSPSEITLDEIDFGDLVGEDIVSLSENLTANSMKSVIIQANENDYKEIKKLIQKAEAEGEYIGGILLEALKK
jgi:ParB-like chromosome segregation protein Spo0J